MHSKTLVNFLKRTTLIYLRLQRDMTRVRSRAELRPLAAAAESSNEFITQSTFERNLLISILVRTKIREIEIAYFDTVVVVVVVVAFSSFDMFDRAEHRSSAVTQSC